MEKIAVKLTNFEKLKILRDQRQEREQELVELEKNIRQLQAKVAEQRFLETLSPYYSMMSNDLPSPDEIDKLEEKRKIIKTLLDTIDNEIPETLKRAQSTGEEESSPEQSENSNIPTQGEGTAKKASFDF